VKPQKIRRAVTMRTVATMGTAALLAAGGGPARAYDPATTHAGLTERAVMASRLHRVLTRQLSRPLGLFEPIVLQSSDVPPAEVRVLAGRLAALDPAGGYRPDPDGAASALSWVIAGTVIAATPAERGQHLFYDPTRGSGLSQAGGTTQFGQGLRQLIDTGGIRALATGTNFNLTGRPATEWLLAPENDVGLPRFYEGMVAAIAGEQPGQRASALARALLALGGTLAVLEDAGEPAHVRNDFRRAYLETAGKGAWDRSSAFERFVADSYGRMGVPAPDHPVARPTVMAFITAGDGQGLADRTQRRFFSDGTLPEDAIVERETSAADVMRDARASLPYAYPRLPRLELKAMGERRYAYVAGPAPAGPGTAGEAQAQAPARRRLLAYLRVPGRVRFFLDRAVYADTAAALLPEIVGYGAGLVDHLFRAELHLAVAGGTATVSVTGVSGHLRKGEVRIYAEDAKGTRKLVTTAAAAGEPISASVPSGTRRLGAVLQGEDESGELVAVAEQPVR
jgi:hypothetical protein